MIAEIPGRAVTASDPGNYASMRPRSDDRGNRDRYFPYVCAMDEASMRPRSDDRGNTVGAGVHILAADELQ